MMRISVIVCAYNEEDNLPLCLPSLMNQNNIDANDYEIIIVDNQSTDRTPVICHDFISERKGKLPFIRYVQIGHLGLSVGRNTGLLRTQAPLVAYIDSDAVADPYWISELIKAWDENPDADAISGRIRIRNTKSRIARFLHEVYYDPMDEQKIIGANMSFRKERLLRAGAFGDPFISRADETFLLFKLGEKRQEVKWPAAVVFHDRPTLIRHWLLERISNGKLAILINRLFKQNNTVWRRFDIKHILLLLIGLACLFNFWFFMISLVGGVIFLCVRTFRGRVYHRLLKKHSKLVSGCMALSWSLLEIAGLFCFLFGALTPGNDRQYHDDSAWQGTVSEKVIMKEVTTGLNL